MKSVYDVIVLGLSAMGSATLYQLAKRGERVLGIDRFSPPHDRGSSHGDTRITRLAIGEGPAYTPLVMRSHRIWREIEKETRTDLLRVTGGLIISSPSKTAVNHVPRFFENTIEAARTHGIAHEILDASAIRRRFPPFKVQDDEAGYYEPGAGFLRPERCVEAQLRLAGHHRAEIRLNEPIFSADPDGKGVVVSTKKGEYRAGRLIVCAGPWIPKLLGPDYAHLFAVRRQVLHWFDIKDGGPFLPGRFPVFFWELQGDRQGIYGFPAIDGSGGGVKIATEQIAETITPDALDRVVSDEEALRTYIDRVRPYFSGILPKRVKSVACMYTVTPDSGFIIDAHPEHEAITIVSACSGHGFKHSAAIGEAVAQLVATGKSDLDLSAFRLDRFAQDLV